MTTRKTKMLQSLQSMDPLFNGFFRWLAGQYDQQTGGFYYAQSAINDDRFTPDIESTSQALSIMGRHDLLQQMPTSMKDRLIQFYQAKQEPDTGYFYDQDQAMRKDDVMVQRAIGYATGALHNLGSKPLYPLPYSAKAAPDYVNSPEAYLEKWKSIDLRNSWRGCDQLATSCFYMAEMSETERLPYVQQATQYLANIQDPETGLWGEGSLYVRISGTFKLHTFYNKFNIPLPNGDRIYNSILTCLRTEEASDMCYIRNPIHLLTYLDLNIPDHELLEIIEITVNNMAKLKRDDGGFSREIDNSPPAPNVAQVKQGEYYPVMPEPVYIGQGLYEGDMNAGTQASLIRSLCYRLIGEPVPKLTQADEFYPHLKQMIE